MTFLSRTQLNEILFENKSREQILVDARVITHILQKVPYIKLLETVLMRSIFSVDALSY